MNYINKTNKYIFFKIKLYNNYHTTKFEYW